MPSKCSIIGHINIKHSIGSQEKQPPHTTSPRRHVNNLLNPQVYIARLETAPPLEPAQFCCLPIALATPTAVPSSIVASLSCGVAVTHVQTQRNDSLHLSTPPQWLTLSLPPSPPAAGPFLSGISRPPAPRHLSVVVVVEPPLFPSFPMLGFVSCVVPVCLA